MKLYSVRKAKKSNMHDVFDKSTIRCHDKNKGG